MKDMWLKSAILAVAGVGLLAGSAFALPVLENGYSWNSADYWTLTDLTTKANGNSIFQLQLERASYESSFGLYTVNDLSNPTEVSQKIEVWSYTDEPGFSTQTVNFKNENGQWQASLDNNNWINFDKTFGFYFEVHTGGTNDSSSDYLWYTDMQFNSLADGTSIDTTIEHVMTAYNSISDQVKIYLDDQLGGGDRDFEDMIVAGDDMAPVPEPATMLLFGTGLAGLAGVVRRKKK